MDTITITPFKEGMDMEKTKRELDIHADGYRKGYKDAINKACEVYGRELQEIIDLFNKFGECKGIDELGDLLSFEGCMKDFRKAMEE